MTTPEARTSLDSILGREDLPKDFIYEAHHRQEDEYSGTCEHNLQRKACLTKPGPVNHGKNVYYIPDNEFDLNKTIFHSVSGMLGFKRLELRNKLGNKLFWKPEEQERIEKKFDEVNTIIMNTVLQQPRWNEYDDIMNFMKKECNFNTEHADGSFMDHLYFCRDYSKVHFNKISPRILFLHSIMGVGTNFFPMEVNKISQLKELLTEEEFKHIAAFPSILRLMNQGDVIQQLLIALNDNKLDDFENISFYRVIDNEEITFTREDFWIAMNIQIIHQLDFLPCSNWCSQITDPMFQVFTEIHELLHKSNKLEAKVAFNISELKNSNEKDEFGMPITVASLLSSRVPSSIKRKAIKKSTESFSQNINHNLNFEISWRNKGKL